MFAFMLLLTQTVLCLDIDEINRRDVDTANVTIAIAERYLTRCTILITADNMTLMENRSVFQIAKMLAMNSGKAISVKTFRRYKNHVKFRYSKDRCAKVLNIVFSPDEIIKKEMEKFPDQDKMKGPVWLFFLNEKTSPSEMFKPVNLTFDINLIAAKEKNKIIYFQELYKVSYDHDVKVQPLGQWSYQKGLSLPDELSLYVRRSNLEGITLKVGYLENPPIQICVKPDCQTGLDDYFGRVWRDLEKTLNFTSKYIKPLDDLYGSFVNGKWNGLIGLVERKEVDAVSADMTMTGQRIDAVDFLHPLLVTSYQIFFQQPGTLEDWYMVLRPFETQLWIVLLLWMFFFSILITIFYRFGVTSNQDRKVFGKKSQSERSVFIIWAALTQQAYSPTPKSCSCRIIVVTTYFCSVVLSAAYSGALTSFVTVEKPLRPFDSIETMLKDGTYRLLQVPGTAGFSYFSDSNNPIIQQTYEQLFAKLPPEKLPKRSFQAIQKVCKRKKVAHFSEYENNRALLRKVEKDLNCRILTLENIVGRACLSIIVQKDSPYKDLFNFYLTRLKYQGILNRFRMQTWGTRRSKNTDMMHSNGFRTVNAEQVSRIYLLLIIGLVFSVITMIIEILIRRYLLRRSELKLPYIN